MRARADRSFLDTPDFRKAYQLSSDQTAMKFYIEGIKCGRCVQKIEALENKILGIQSLRINMSTHQLEMILDDKQTSFAKAID
ncbi:MAG: cation transporter, partial [Bdellovibrio sp.]|nr:cation transporter [Bdellovibrio sp.]